MNEEYWEDIESIVKDRNEKSLKYMASFIKEPETHIHLKGNDDITAPAHYMLFDDMEAIEAIEKLLTPEEYMGYLKGCELKYRFRAGKKDSVEKDIGKAGQYAKFREAL